MVINPHKIGGRLVRPSQRRNMLRHTYCLVFGDYFTTRRAESMTLNSGETRRFSSETGVPRNKGHKDKGPIFLTARPQACIQYTAPPRPAGSRGAAPKASTKGS